MSFTLIFSVCKGEMGRSSSYLILLIRKIEPFPSPAADIAGVGDEGNQDRAYGHSLPV